MSLFMSSSSSLPLFGDRLPVEGYLVARQFELPFCKYTLLLDAILSRFIVMMS